MVLMCAFHDFVLITPEGPEGLNINNHGWSPWLEMKRAYDFGGIFGEASKNHDKIPTTNLRSDEMHPLV